MRAKAGKDGLYHVDVEMCTDFASAAKAAGVRSVVMLSGAARAGLDIVDNHDQPSPLAAGADPAATYSRLTGSAAGGGWYSHCKGRAEQNLMALGFRHLAVFRPGTITGNANTPAAWAWVAGKIDRILPARFRQIAQTVR